MTATVDSRRRALSIIPRPDEDEIILAMCRAHDAEEAAQIGEPSPWREDFDRDLDWEQRRFLAMREAYDVAIKMLGLCA
ncbi:MAG: hypothetical protein ACOY4K_00680 [Pseudomonadota bacterium]